MARRSEVRVRITGESRSAEAASRRAETAVSRLGRTIKSNMVLAIGSATLATAGLVRGIRALVGAATREEDAIRSLDAAVAKIGERAGEVSRELQEQAAALQKVTTVGNEAIIAGQALIASFTTNGEQIKQATQAALDLSAAVGVDLNAAFLLMGKAAAGETTTLSRYGIILDEGLPKSEKFAAALAKVNEQFGGRAQEQAKTFSGQLSRLKNALGDVVERLGEGITKNEGLGSSIERLTKFVQENEAAIARFASSVSGAFTQAIGGAVNKLQQLGSAIGTVVVKLNEWAGTFDQVQVSEAALEATAKRLGISVEELRQRMAASVGPIGAVNAASEQLNRTQKDQTETTRKLTAAEQELAETADAFSEAMKRLGVTLDADVATQIQANNDALELAERRMKLGEITAEDYERAQAAVAEANRELAESVRPAREEVERMNDAFGRSREELDLTTGVIGRTALAYDGLAASARLAREEQESQAAFSQNTLGGRSTFAQIGGGTFQYNTPLREPEVSSISGRLVVGV